MCLNLDWITDFLSRKICLGKHVETSLAETVFGIDNFIETNSSQPSELLRVSWLVNQRVNPQSPGIDLPCNTEGASMISDSRLVDLPWEFAIIKLVLDLLVRRLEHH